MCLLGDDRLWGAAPIPPRSGRAELPTQQPCRLASSFLCCFWNRTLAQPLMFIMHAGGRVDEPQPAGCQQQQQQQERPHYLELGTRAPAGFFQQIAIATGGGERHGSGPGNEPSQPAAMPHPDARSSEPAGGTAGGGARDSVRAQSSCRAALASRSQARSCSVCSSEGGRSHVPAQLPGRHLCCSLSSVATLWGGWVAEGWPACLGPTHCIPTPRPPGLWGAA